MIKLKSLFRRGGQGPSGSSKQPTNNTNSQLRGASSASSLNSIGLSTTSSSTTATTKSSKSALKKAGHTGSTDHFESATFHESHESLDLKNASKLYAQSSGSGHIGSSSSISGGINLSFTGNGANNNSSSSGGGNSSSGNNKFTTHSPESAASISASSNKQYGFGIGSRTHDELRADQLHYIQTSMLTPTEQLLSSKSASTSGCVNKLSNEYRDSDNETGVDDGGTSCFSGSMRDLLSTENLTEDCTFNGTDESQVKFFWSSTSCEPN